MECSGILISVVLFWGFIFEISTESNGILFHSVCLVLQHVMSKQICSIAIGICENNSVRINWLYCKENMKDFCHISCLLMVVATFFGEVVLNICCAAHPSD